MASGNHVFSYSNSEYSRARYYTAHNDKFKDGLQNGQEKVKEEVPSFMNH